MHEKFRWTSPAGVEIVLPPMRGIKAGILRRHRKEEPVDFIFSVLEETSDDDMLAKLDDLTFEELNDLGEKWQEGATLGESSGSSN